jgi:hypothetical protein
VLAGASRAGGGCAPIAVLLLEPGSAFPAAISSPPAAGIVAERRLTGGGERSRAAARKAGSDSPSCGYIRIVLF